jgi:beta-fructofuranosidase
MAHSRDGGISFQKYQDNPVIASVPEGISADFRDPRVIRHNGFWYMVLGASLGKGAWRGGDGCACLYRSENLKKWEYCGIIARSEGRYGTMWECPDLFPLDGKWILAFSPMFMEGRKAVYLTGEMDFDIPRFTILSDGEIDWGCEYYAAQSMLDGAGRRVLMAWQNGWDWMPWWKDFGPTVQEGWCGCMALPRAVALDPANKLISKPVCELEMLRKNNKKIEGLKVGAEKISIPCADPVSFELKMEIDLVQTAAKKLHILLRANTEKYTVVTIDFLVKKLRFDRNNSDDGYSSGIKECNLLLNGDFCILCFFSDTSSIEIFTDEGRTSMSNTIYPLHPNQETCVWAEGGEAFFKTINTWALGL